MQPSSSSSEHDDAEPNRDLNFLFPLYCRLDNCLDLCYRKEEGELRWCSPDVETMKKALHSIDAFLDGISTDMSRHRLVKGKVGSILSTLGNISQQKNETLVILASDAIAKLVNIIPSPIVETLVSDICNVISSSSSSASDVVGCAMNMSWILAFLSVKRDRLVWKLLEEAKIVDNIINHMCSGGSKPDSFFLETINLLSTILSRWRTASFRFCAWNNSGLMEKLINVSLEANHSLKAAVLNLYTSIALCNNGAKKLLDSGNPASLQLMVNCMDSVNPVYLKMAGFRLAECFVECEEGRKKMIELHGKPLVKAIVDGLSTRSWRSKNPTKDQMSLIKGACCASKIICWPGKHNVDFWELGIESVLLKLLLPNSRIPQKFLSSDKLITFARNGLNGNFLKELKPHIWDILGGLAAHCAEDFTSDMLKRELHLQILITCACVSFMDSLYSVCEKHGKDANEPVSRAVLLMIYSPSEYIVSQVKSILPGNFAPNADVYIHDLLNLEATVSDDLQVIRLISLAYYVGVHGKYFEECNGITPLLSYIEGLYENRPNIKPQRIFANTSAHFCDHNKNMCCYESEEKWIGDEMFMVFSLLGLAELIRFYRSSSRARSVWITNQFEAFGVAKIITIMQDICINYTDSGARWYAAYILSHFGVYGFPSKFGNKIGYVLRNPEDVKVNDLVVRIRCKQLQSDPENVDKEALQKLLEYVYRGYLKSENQDLVKSLEKLAKKYNLQALSQILGRSRPVWRTPFPVFDLTSAREPGPDGLDLSDFILVANGKTFDGWKCETCNESQPHLHAHKDILFFRCEHIHGMRSEMQESPVNTIEIDIGWEALVKLVNWFYSGEMVPKPKDGCLWSNLNDKEKIEHIIPYVELYSLSNYPLLGDLQEDCKTVISLCLDSVDMALKGRQMAGDLSQPDLAELADLVLDKKMGEILISLRKSQEGDTSDF